MLLPYTNLVYYGPASATMVVEDSVGTLETAEPHQTMAAAVSVMGEGIAEMRPYRGRMAAMETGGIGTLHRADAKRRIRAALTVAVNELSQDDVQGAVLDSNIEGGLSLRHIAKLLLSFMASNATGLSGPEAALMSLDGSKVRIQATLSGGNRVVTLVDPT